MADYKIDDTVDITDVVCPVTFVKAKVALEELDDGQILAVRMNNGEPVQNVPRSIKEEGHQILKLTDNGDDTFTLIVRKVEDELYGTQDQRRKLRRKSIKGRQTSPRRLLLRHLHSMQTNGLHPRRSRRRERRRPLHLQSQRQLR